MLDEIEIGGPIIKSSAAQRLVYGAVLVPLESDSDGDVVTADKIESVAHDFMLSYKNVDIQHSLNNVGQVVESYITPQDMEVTAYGEKVRLPKGTWVLGTKVSETAWKSVESGVLTGYSIMGVRSSEFLAASKAGDFDEASLKRTLLSDLGEDWLVVSVSLVDFPAVPKAQFFAMKAKEFTEYSQPSFFAKVGKMLGFSSAEKEGRRFSDKTYNDMQTAYTSLATLIAEAEAERSSKQEGDDMDIAEMNEAIKAAVLEAVTPLQERLVALEAVKAEETAEVVVEQEEVSEEVSEKAAEEVVVEEEVEVVDKAAEEEAFRVAVEERIAALETRVKRSVTSKALENEGAAKVAAVEEKYPRDSFGQRLHTA